MSTNLVADFCDTLTAAPTILLINTVKEKTKLLFNNIVLDLELTESTQLITELRKSIGLNTPNMSACDNSTIAQFMIDGITNDAHAIMVSAKLAHIIVNNMWNIGEKIKDSCIEILGNDDVAVLTADSAVSCRISAHCDYPTTILSANDINMVIIEEDYTSNSASESEDDMNSDIVSESDFDFNFSSDDEEEKPIKSKSCSDNEITTVCLAEDGDDENIKTVVYDDSTNDADGF